MAVNGGAIDSVKGPFTVTDSTLTGNQAVGGSGGAIAAGGTFTLNGGNITGNSAGDGGGIAATGAIAISASSISDNAALGKGGGIYVVGNLTVNGATALTGNTAQLRWRHLERRRPRDQQRDDRE